MTLDTRLPRLGKIIGDNSIHSVVGSGRVFLHYSEGPLDSRFQDIYYYCIH